jgi:hypothetical protein
MIDIKKSALNIRQMNVKFPQCLINSLTYTDFFLSRSLKQPPFPEIRTHDYRLVESPFAPTPLYNIRAARSSKQKNLGSWRFAEVSGIVGTTNP